VTEWTEQKERGNPIALKLICWVALHLSRGFSRLWLWPITLYFFFSSRKVRHASRQYLTRVNGCHGNVWEVIRHIHTFSAIILDRVYFLTDQFHQFEIEVYNEECLQKVMAQGKGGILLGAHVGSFDALRCLAIERKHLPLKILMYQDHNAMITRILDELNPEITRSVINLADPSALLKMKEAIEQGSLIGMLGDRVLKDEKKVRCTFLGGEVEMPAGPFTLALLLGVPVVGFFGIYRGGNRYEVHHSILYDGVKVPRSERQALVDRLTQEYVNNIENMLQIYPYNWFNFYDFWGDAE